MNSLARTNQIQIGNTTYARAELDLVRRTVAKDCDPDEFNQFIMTASRLRLDPLRRQIYAFVFSKDRPDKRNMVIVVGIDGFRTVAARSGDYRPDERSARFDLDQSIIDPLRNPTGLVSAEVTVYRHSHGEWFPVTAIAFWDEFAPIIEGGEWAESSSGKNYFKRDGTYRLDPKKEAWHRMPRVMLAKCAEAQALRRGWPDDLSNVYEQSELDQSQTIDITPHEYAEQGAVERRLERVTAGKDTILMDWFGEVGLEMTPIGQVADRVAAFIKEHGSEVVYWRERNAHPLREFWARNPTDALEVKKMIEAEERKTKVDPHPLASG